MMRKRSLHLLVFGLLALMLSSVGCSPVSGKGLGAVPDRSGSREGTFFSLEEYAHLKGRLRWPVQQREIRSRFGPRNGRFHEGLDLKAREGERVFAAHGGEVVFSGRMRGYGKVVIVKYHGIATLYAHNSQNVVESGDIVRRGEVIALAGSTGRATGPHLHFEVRLRDRKNRFVAVNPVVFLG